MEILLTLVPAIILLLLIAKANNFRNENYSRDCPKCGYKNVHPKTTGLRNQYGTCYDYTCPKCGHKFSNW
jgi:transposase-like protein